MSKLIPQSFKFFFFGLFVIMPCVVHADVDSDGIGDNLDNCIEKANPNQVDTDEDGFGNACDGDLNNDYKTDLADFIIFYDLLGTADPTADFVVDGIVDISDYTTMLFLQGGAPGPSALQSIPLPP